MKKLVALLAIVLIGYGAYAEYEDSTYIDRTMCYTVQSGDTVWWIAEGLKSQTKDPRDIREIIYYSSAADGNITAGQQIIFRMRSKNNEGIKR